MSGFLYSGVAVSGFVCRLLGRFERVATISFKAVRD